MDTQKNSQGAESIENKFKLQDPGSPITSYIEHMENMLLTYFLTTFKREYPDECEYKSRHFERSDMVLKGFAWGLPDVYILLALEEAFPDLTAEEYKDALRAGQLDFAELNDPRGYQRSSALHMALSNQANICMNSDLFKSLDFNIYL